MKSGEGQHGVIQIRAQDKSPKVKFQKQARRWERARWETGTETANWRGKKRNRQARADRRKGRWARTRWNQPGQTRRGKSGPVKHDENELTDGPSGYRVLPRSELAFGFKQKRQTDQGGSMCFILRTQTTTNYGNDVKRSTITGRRRKTGPVFALLPEDHVCFFHWYEQNEEPQIVSWRDGTNAGNNSGCLWLMNLNRPLNACIKRQNPNSLGQESFFSCIYSLL